MIEMKNVSIRYSHAYLIGRIETICSANDLDTKEWVNQKLGVTDYETWCKYYYRSHIDAMVEAEGQDRSSFLDCVKHFKHEININGELEDYKFNISAIHLFFFPFNITLVALEINDSGNTLNNMTWGHGKLMNWNNNYSTFPQLVKTAVSPLKGILASKDLSKLCVDGNKFKIYQVVNVERQKDADMRALLFEIGTSSPIDCVNENGTFTPSRLYYDEIMSNNLISTFDNWSALALVDSFTFLSNTDRKNDVTWDDFYEDWNHYYFRLIYVRCIFEKIFCFSRNNAYRSNIDNEELSDEITKMERYYFYDNISYNFQPRLLYEMMARGLGIKNEREELSKQVKEYAKLTEEKERASEERKKEYITLALSVFAVFSVAWDLCSIIKDAFVDGFHLTAIIIFCCSIVAVLLLAIYIFIIKKHGAKG